MKFKKICFRLHASLVHRSQRILSDFFNSKKEELPEAEFGSPRAGIGMWASKVSIISPETGQTLHSVALEQNQGIHSMCLTKFQSVGMIDWYLLVGTSNSMILNPRQCQGGSIHVYRIHAGERFEYLHSTYLEDTPTAITAFQVNKTQNRKIYYIRNVI